MDWLWLIVPVWLLCGVVTAGMEIAYFQGKYPSIAEDQYREDLSWGLMVGCIYGPLGTVMAVFSTGFCKYGWHLRYRDPRCK